MLKIFSKTFGMIKPKAVFDKKIGNIIIAIEKNGFIIEKMENRKLTHNEVSQLYDEHKNTPKFEGLCKYIESDNCVIMQLHHNDESEPTFLKWRKLIGITDPLLASEGTLRHIFGTSKRQNAVHGSDSPESAQRELNIFFK